MDSFGCAPLFFDLFGLLIHNGFQTFASKLATSCHGKLFHLSEHLSIRRCICSPLHLSKHRQRLLNNQSFGGIVHANVTSIHGNLLIQVSIKKSPI